MNTTTQAIRFEEETLVRRAMDGDLEAFNEIVLHYQDLAYSHAYALLGDLDRAEDAAQEAFVRAFQAMSGFRGGSMRGWLLKIVTNSAFDLLRRSRRRPVQPLFLEDEYGEEIESPSWLADPGPSVEKMTEQNELAKDIYAAIDSLPEGYRSVLTLIDVHELDYAEAAQALNIPLGTVKSRLARARLQVKERLLDSPARPQALNNEHLCLAV